ncbi:MAG: tRNA dihydrouridine(20/20a) synthase DusA [Pseudohongiella sp.]|nr:tRNA dihydrouridine(20/20a) synthase DusA [Pseudohongiella sp.]
MSTFSSEQNQVSRATSNPALSHRFCVAPMLDWTDRHERYFLRLLSRHTRLYTEMITTGALLFGDAKRHLDFNAEEHPLALQLGGSDPDALSKCAELAERWSYDEINLNIGCPSDRVQSGRFGACLMAEPELVAQCISAMKNVTDMPVTIKSRIGINEFDNDDFLRRFMQASYEAGCRIFIVHARIALLAGLSPKENRDIPPLNYDRVARMKEQFTDCTIVLNGGINSLEQASDLLKTFDGVMLGREIYHNPFLLSQVDQRLFGAETEALSRSDIMTKFIPYVREQLHAGAALQHMTRHILGLYKGQPGGRLFRRHLSENAWKKQAGISVLEDACALAESH